MIMNMYIEEWKAKFPQDPSAGYRILYERKPDERGRMVGIVGCIEKVIDKCYTDYEECLVVFTEITEHGTRYIVKADLTEGSEVTVIIDGDIVERVVRYSKQDGDLYVIKNNKKYFYSEFVELVA